jgi:5-methylcytosine-specific restriction endonuclease McrA
MKYTVLILNLDYSPYDIWDWKHAITKYLCTNSVEAVYEDDGIVKYDRVLRDGMGNEYEQPAVLRLAQYYASHNGRAPYTKLNVYARDLGLCQYCGKETTPNTRTIDHVIPRAHWNPRRFHFKLNSFENVVTACGPCNKLKRNRTPQQADMDLIQKTKIISRVQAYRNKLAMIPNKPVQWQPYLKVTNVTKT